MVIGLLITRLKKLSATDSLTQVYNRGYFTQQFEKQLSLAKRYYMPISLVIIDLDRFKEHNDNFGHIFGDRVLRDVALRLQSLVRATDTVARYGGDEFVILLPHTDTSGAVNLIQRVKDDICEQVLHNTNITFSAGVASYPTDGATVEELLLRADKALYAAKGARNCVQCYARMTSTNFHANSIS